ncbi:MAG: glycerophosphodiester phosphodiesterase [Clostridia bacterium]|nr:glycerophosphodiester phosphodiesterase [Clostridia bacterium]MBQ5793439.1 glycerophosphodiester phosphodiesterase [Clostridia bacterium]
MPPYVWVLCIAGGVLLLTAVIYLYMIKPASVKGVNMAKYGKKFAHRGLWDADSPENSLAAFKKAVDAGYGIEFDIHKTSDGHVVVFHDDTLTRMCGVEGKIEQKTLAELRELRLKGTDQQIPTLQEMLALVDGRVPLLVELKGEDVSTALCPVANEILSAYKGDYMVESFNPLLVRWYKKHRPDVVRGQLFCNLNGGKGYKKAVYYLITALLTNVLARPHFLARGQDSARNPSFLIGKHLFRAPSYVWTVRAQDQIPSPESGEGIIFEGFIPKD